MINVQTSYIMNNNNQQDLFFKLQTMYVRLDKLQQLIDYHYVQHN